MLRRTPLKRNKRLSPISGRYIDKRNSEILDRVKLCRRCGGQLQVKCLAYQIKGETKVMVSVRCYNGDCEICGNHVAGFLDPHEYILTRGKGGRVSVDNSKMVCRGCHNKETGELHWSK